METQLLDKSYKDFLTDLASKEPTPGGGGAAEIRRAHSGASELHQLHPGGHPPAAGGHAQPGH